MIAKKSVSKSKDKNHTAADTNGSSKRKPSAEAKSTAQVMDARLSQDRRQGDRRQREEAIEVERRSGPRRAKVNRRRQIDPTTCERDYSPAEVEFMGALDDYKRRSGRMFPTCSEVLEVFLGLGYEKRDGGSEHATSAAPLVETVTLPATNEVAV